MFIGLFCEKNCKCHGSGKRQSDFIVLSVIVRLIARGTCNALCARNRVCVLATSVNKSRVCSRCLRNSTTYVPPRLQINNRTSMTYFADASLGHNLGEHLCVPAKEHASELSDAYSRERVSFRRLDRDSFTVRWREQKYMNEGKRNKWKGKRSNETNFIISAIRDFSCSLSRTIRPVLIEPHGGFSFLCQRNQPGSTMFPRLRRAMAK